MQKATTWAGCCLVAALVLSGCDGKPGMATVAGTVTLDGKPVPVGSILFVPVDGQSPTAGGSIQNGRYSVQVPLGRMKVSLSVPKVVGKKKIYPTPNSPEMPITEEALPAKYNEQTDLQVDVNARTKRQDFVLLSD